MIIGAHSWSVTLVNDVIMPPIGFFWGELIFLNLFIILKEGKALGPYASVAAAKTAGAVTMNIGLFINTIINFLMSPMPSSSWSAASIRCAG